MNDRKGTRARKQRGRSNTGPRAKLSGSPQARAKATKRNSPGKLRIIGGDMGGRTIRYHGAPFTRPMKDSVRENMFNILGKAVKGACCFDLFAGTGVVAFEALSRGAVSAVAVEQSRIAVRFIRESAESIGVEGRLRVVTGDTFRLASHLLASPADDTPWIVVLCPPYRMWEDEDDFPQLCSIIRTTLEHAPPGSVLVAETDRRFDPDRLPGEPWDLREYGDTRLAFIEPAMKCGLRP